MRLMLSIILLAFSVSAISQHNDGIHFFSGTIEEALVAAKAAGKNVYIDCQTSWCGPCNKMSKDIFTNKKVAKFYNEHFISISLDMEKEGKSMAHEFDVRYYPTHIYLAPSRTIIHNVFGFQYSEQFIETARTALDPEKQNGRFRIEYDQGNRSSKFLLEYAAHLRENRLPVGEVFDLYLQSLPFDSLSVGTVKDYVFNYTETTQSFAYQQFIIAKKAAEKESQYRQNIIQKKHEKIIKSSIHQAFKTKNLTWLGAIEQECDNHLAPSDKYQLILIPNAIINKDANGMVTAINQYLQVKLGTSVPAEIASTSALKKLFKKVKKENKVVIVSRTGKKTAKKSLVAESLYQWVAFLSNPRNRVVLTDRQKNLVQNWREIAYLIDKDEKYLN